MLSIPVCLSRAGLKKCLAQFDSIANWDAVVAEEFYVVVDERMQPECGRRKLIGNTRIHVRVVAAVGSQRTLPQ